MDAAVQRVYTEKTDGKLLRTKTAGQNPGWVLVPAGMGKAFVGMEDEPGSIQGYSIDTDDPSKLSEVGARVSSVGRHPCSLALDASGKWLLVRPLSVVYATIPTPKPLTLAPSVVRRQQTTHRHL